MSIKAMLGNKLEKSDEVFSSANSLYAFHSINIWNQKLVTNKTFAKQKIT